MAKCNIPTTDAHPTNDDEVLGRWVCLMEATGLADEPLICSALVLVAYRAVIRRGEPGLDAYHRSIVDCLRWLDPDVAEVLVARRQRRRAR